VKLAAGQQLGGLRIEKELGRGAYGVVYLARDALIGRRVALKVLPGGGHEVPEEARQGVVTEARLVGNLTSPNIVTLFRLHAAEDGGWMQEMELVEGGSLEDRLVADQPLPFDETVRVLHGIASALRTAHAARIIHGDIKPANVLFGEGGVVKLADFGLGRLLEGTGTSVELHGEITGTPHYMAPEVISGQHAGMASDIWAVGVLAYRLCAGRMPFPAITLMELVEGIREREPDPLPGTVPEPLQDLVRRCLGKQAEERPTAAQILDMLEARPRLDDSWKAPAAARLTNLVPPPSSFVGRSREIEELTAVLTGAVPLVTILGPGGIGKTRLSQELCRRLLDRFEGGCWFADLSETRDADGVAHAVALALDVRPSGEPAEAVAAMLQYRKPLLLVLDNFEQVIEDAHSTVGLWMARAPHVRFLVTSRALLGLGGEHVRELHPLETPRIHTAADDLVATAAFPGVRLFVERAREAKPGFDLDPGNATDVARIVAELEGMPLAIELAAARIGIMRPAQIAQKLGQKFSLLKSTRRDVTARQKTLHGAIDWSYDLLADWEKEAFLQACWFRDGLSLDAAETVIDLSAFDDAPLAMDVAQSLRDKSLLHAYDAGQETRLSMYRAIQEYGQGRWAKDADENRRAGLARRHAEFHLALAEDWNAEVFGKRSLEALDRIDLEVGNIARAQEWALEAGEAGIAARLVLAAAETMRIRRPARQLIPLLERALEGVARGPMAAMLRAHLSSASQMTGDWDRAAAAADEAVALAREAGEDRSLTLALLEQGAMRRLRGDPTGAKACFEESETLARAEGDRHALARATGSRGMILGEQGDLDGALSCFVEAERLAREVGDQTTVALHVGNRGIVCEARGELDAAIACQREAEDISRRMGDRLWAAVSLGKRAGVHAQAGDLETSVECYREAESIARELGARQRIAHIVGNRGSVHSMRGEREAALACYEEAESIARDLGDRRQIAMMLGKRGNLLGSRGETDRGLECMAEAEVIGRELGDRALVALNLCRRGDLCLLCGRTEEAWEALSRGIAMYDEIHANQSVWYFSFKAGLARAAAERGDADEARRIADEALKLARAIGLTREHPDPSVREGVAAAEQLAR